MQAFEFEIQCDRVVGAEEDTLVSAGVSVIRLQRFVQGVRGVESKVRRCCHLQPFPLLLQVSIPTYSDAKREMTYGGVW